MNLLHFEQNLLLLFQCLNHTADYFLQIMPQTGDKLEARVETVSVKDVEVAYLFLSNSRPAGGGCPVSAVRVTERCARFIR